MKFKLTFFLLLANIAVFGVLWHELAKNDMPVGAEHSIFTAGIEKIDIAVPADKESSFSLEIKDRNWIVKKGFDWPANTFAVREVLHGLHFLDPRNSFSVKDALETGSTLASFGLETPRMIVTISDNIGDRELRFGDLTPDGTCVYALLPDGDRIAPLPKSLLFTLSKQAEDFRVNEVFMLRPFEIQALTVRIENGASSQRIGLKRSLVSQGKGVPATRQWLFETPIAVKAESQMTEECVNRLVGLSRGNFVDASAQTGLDKPSMRVSLESANSSETLLVGNAVPENPEQLYAKLENNPAVFTVERAVVSEWKTAATDLRDPYFFDFDPAVLRAIEIADADGKSIRLVRVNNTEVKEVVKEVESGEMDLDNVPAPIQKAEKAIFSTWEIPGTTLGVDPKVLDSLVERLRQLRAISYPVSADILPTSAEYIQAQAFVSDTASLVEQASLGLDKPIWTVTISLAGTDGKTIQKVLKIAEATKDYLPQHAQVEHSIYSIDKDLSANLSVSPLRYRSRNILKLPAGTTVENLKIVDLRDNESVIDESLVAGTQNRALESFLKQCENIQAESFIDSNFSQTFVYDYLDAGVPETWAYRVELTYKTPTDTESKTLTLHLTRRLGGNFQIAGLEAQNIVFCLNQTAIDAFHALTFKNYAEKNILNTRPTGAK
ncbi:MAG: DUF4340 domain-containing protein [Opitutales bacterium]|nr:DUF4340 domain-containing protein [Opitutales bacterium]